MIWRGVAIVLALTCGVVAQGIAQGQLPINVQPTLALPMFALGAILLVVSVNNATP